MTTVVFLTACIADGQSLMRLKDSQRSGNDVATDYAGFGLWKDYTGHSWESDLNGMHACDDRHEIGQTMAGFALMALIFAGLAVMCNLMGLQSGRGVFGFAAAGLNVLVFVFAVMTMALAGALFDQEYCDVESKDDYDLHYALPMLVFVVVFALAGVGALVAMGAMKDATEATQETKNEPIAAETPKEETPEAKEEQN